MAVATDRLAIATVTHATVAVLGQVALRIRKKERRSEPTALRTILGAVVRAVTSGYRQLNEPPTPTRFWAPSPMMGATLIAIRSVSLR